MQTVIPYKIRIRGIFVWLRLKMKSLTVTRYRKVTIKTPVFPSLMGIQVTAIQSEMKTKKTTAWQPPNTKNRIAIPFVKMTPRIYAWPS
jgi:hypothetical protein